jgi:hypothetical protein
MAASPHFFLLARHLPDGRAKRICMDTLFCSISYSADRIVRASLASYISLRQRLSSNKPPQYRRRCRDELPNR